jgi:nitroreductase
MAKYLEEILEHAQLNEDHFNTGDIVSYKGREHRVIHVLGPDTKSATDPQAPGKDMSGHYNIVPNYYEKRKSWPSTVHHSEIKLVRKAQQ